MSGESSLETNCQLEMSTGAGSVLYNSIHSSVAEAEVPTQEISFMTTLPDILVVDKLGIGEGVGEGNSLGVGTGVFDGDGVGDTVVSLVSGVFVTTGVGDTDVFVTFGSGVTSLSPSFELSTPCGLTMSNIVSPINPNNLANQFFSGGLWHIPFLPSPLR